MRGLPTVAGHQALRAGTLLIAAGSLALYQMTSLVLGPAGSHQLHISLSLPAVEPDELSESWSAGPSLSLGTLAPLAPVVSTQARSTVTHRATIRPAGHLPAAPAAPVAVTPQSPTTQPSVHPTPSPDGLPVPLADGQHEHGD